MTKWTPCSEKLPEKPGYYLITIKIEIQYLKPYYTVCTAEFNGQYFDTIKLTGDDSVSVNAWMPLPTPYKAESEEVEV